MTTTVTVKEDKLRVYIFASKEVIAQLREDFRFRPNGYNFSAKYELYRLSGGEEGWDGYVYPLVRTGFEQAMMPRGYREEVLAACRHRGYEVNENLLPRPFAAVMLADIVPDVIKTPYQLDVYQRQGVLAWLRESIGICQVTVSGGKTCMFCAAARIIKDRFPKTRFIYMTPSERLVKQVTASAREYLPDFEVGQYGGGKAEMNAADMVVCTVAMLNRNVEHLTRAGWFKTFNCILFDEVHHCGSASAERVLAQIPAFWRFGASDTTKEDDPARRSKMVGQFGSTLIEVKATPHIESGRMATPHIYVEDMGDYRNRFDGLDFTAALGTPAWCLIEKEWKQAIYRGPVQKLDSDGNPVMKKKFTVEKVDDKIVKKTEEVAVTEIGLHLIEVDSENIVMESRWVLLSRVYDLGIILFKERNARIVKWASYYSSKGYPTLVVATRTLHIYILETLLKEAARPELVRILFGWATPNERDEAFDWFRATPGSILITPLVKEGVSINEIRAGVIADCVGDSETANQIIGRFLRKKPDEGENFAEITWFRDSQHPTLRRSSNHVLTAFAGYGYNVYDGPSAPDIDRLLKGVQSPASGAKAKPKRRRRA